MERSAVFMFQEAGVRGEGLAMQARKGMIVTIDGGRERGQIYHVRHKKAIEVFIEQK